MHTHTHECWLTHQSHQYVCTQISVYTHLMCAHKCFTYTLVTHSKHTFIHMNLYTGTSHSPTHACTWILIYIPAVHTNMNAHEFLYTPIHMHIHMSTCTHCHTINMCTCWDIPYSHTPICVHTNECLHIS